MLGIPCAEHVEVVTVHEAGFGHGGARAETGGVVGGGIAGLGVERAFAEGAGLEVDRVTVGGCRRGLVEN